MKIFEIKNCFSCGALLQTPHLFNYSHTCFSNKCCSSDSCCNPTAIYFDPKIIIIRDTTFFSKMTEYDYKLIIYKINKSFYENLLSKDLGFLLNYIDELTKNFLILK